MKRSASTIDLDPVPADWISGLSTMGPSQALKLDRSMLVRVVAPLISLAILAVAASQLAHLDLAATVSLIPASIAFWLVFALYYAVAPLADWVIFRRLWNIPASGLAPLTRKLIGNELLFGYAGELYFYSWARRNATMVGSPFGAIKDVAILSAVAGNVITLAMTVIAYPLLRDLHLSGEKALILSFAVVLGTSLVAMMFRARLFSLPRSDLHFVTLIHVVRIVATTGLTAWIWHLALPQVPISLWFFLSTLRLLLSRLPLIPNKDVVFAGLAIFLIGQDHAVVALMAAMAGLIMMTHVVLGTVLAGLDIVGWSERR